MRTTNNLLKSDKYGSLWDVEKLTCEIECAWIGVVVTVLACLLDFFNVFTRYDHITQPTAILMLVAMTLGTVIVLDVPMYVAGSVLKAYMQKLKPKTETVIIIVGSVAAFLTVAVLNLVLGLECGRFMLEDPAETAAGIFSEVEATNSVEIGSWILGLLPVLTSIAAFVVGLYCSNPRLHNVNQCKKALNQTRTFISEGKKALAEAFYYDPKLVSFANNLSVVINDMKTVDPNNKEAQLAIVKRLEDLSGKVDETYANSTLLKNIIAKHKAAVQEVYAQELVREQATLTALQRKLNTPDDSSVIAADAIKLANDYKDIPPAYSVFENNTNMSSTPHT